VPDREVLGAPHAIGGSDARRFRVAVVEPHDLLDVALEERNADPDECSALVIPRLDLVIEHGHAVLGDETEVRAVGTCDRAIEAEWRREDDQQRELGEIGGAVSAVDRQARATRPRAVPPVRPGVERTSVGGIRRTSVAAAVPATVGAAGVRHPAVARVGGHAIGLAGIASGLPAEAGPVVTACDGRDRESDGEPRRRTRAHDLEGNGSAATAHAAHGACGRRRPRTAMLARMWRPALLVLVSALASVEIASAQPDARDVRAARSATPPSPILVQDAPAVVFAQRHFERGVALYDARQLEDAMSAFQASFELAASPNSRLYVARCLRELGRIADAVIVFEEALQLARVSAADSPRYRDTERAAREELAQLERRVARVVLRTGPLPPGSTVTANGRPVPLAAIGLPWPVDPGEVRIEVHASDGRSAQHTVSIAAGREATVDLSGAREPVPASERAPVPVPQVVRASSPSTSAAPSSERATEPRARGGAADPWPALAISAGALAVVGWVGVGVFFGLADARYRELEEACGAAPCPPALDGQIAEGETFDTLAYASIAVGAIGSALAIAFAVIASDAGGADGAETTRLSIGPGSLAVDGRF
jgi:hypothetical protein